MGQGLFDYAYCPRLDEKLEMLASIAASEPWCFPDDTGLPILWNYIHHTFRRIAESCDAQGTPCLVHLGENGSQACFNTGLYTLNFEPIFAFLEANRIPDRQPWVLKGFFKESDYHLRPFPKLPERASYFREISDLVFDYRLDIRINRDHILTDPDNLERLPQNLQAPTAFDGAVAIAKKKVSANYKLAVPQYYEGRIQLLIPLGFDPGRANVALVITKENQFYTGHTCLTLKMAYNNARLIAKPDSDWLKPDSNQPA